MATTAARRQFKVRGLDCAQEVVALKREVGPLVGGEERLGFDLLKGRMTVAAAAEEVPDREVLRAVERAGLAAEAWEEEGRRPAEGGWSRRARPLLVAASGLATLAGFVAHAAAAGLQAAFGSEGLGLAHHAHGAAPAAARALYGLAIAAGGWFVLPRAWAALRRARPDMNLLMTIAVAGALVLGEWLEAALVTFLFALSLVLEAWSVARARRAVEALVELAPQRVRVLGDGGEEECDAAGLPAGIRFLVRPGERVPLDGVVAQGESALDQAPITGESIPIEKRTGDEVFAGSINGDGALVVVSTRPAEETTLARLVRMVEEAQERRAPSERWVDRFARVYTPAVMAAALLVFLAPPLFFGAAWGEWFYRALVLLVIACPCALVISTPVSIVAGLAAAAHHGVLIKGGLFLEVPARLKALALDKTGTLTRGRAAVVDVVPLADHDEAGLLARAAALEARSSHPIARAILERAAERRVAVRAADGLQVLQGRGATGRLDGREYWLGSHRYLEQRGQETPEVHARLEAMSDAGHTAVAVGTAEHVCGLVAVADPVRPEARAALAELHRLGIRPIVMLTGDNRGTADGVMREAGLDEVRAELLPAEKVAAVEELVGRHGTVAMVGDGVNDAPAMARATLSVAMGAAGSDAAIETADVALMSDDLGKLPWLVRHSRRTLAVIRQNVAFALLVKAVFVALTLAGHASLWAAIAADMGASLLVIANGLRLLRG